MSNLEREILGILLAFLVAGAAEAIPPAPSIIEEWAREGRLDELAAIETEARRRGVNDPGLLLPRKGQRDVVGERQAIVVLVDFDDNPADLENYPVEHFEEMLFSLGTYPSGSMRDYFAENSYGQLDLTGTVVGWYRMPEDYAYYTNGQYGVGPYPRNAQRLTEDAVEAADPDVDFSQFDSDGPDGVPNSGDDDGYVDALFVVHAGPEGAGGDGWAIWSHAWVTSYAMPVDGVYVYGYSMEPEDGTIGVFCHELGHVFGLPDLYDYGYDSAGVGYWSVMSFGCHANSGQTPVHFEAWCKMKLGWIDPVVPQFDRVGVEIPPVETTPVSYKIWTDGNPANEYFMIEYRKRQLFDSYSPGEGLVVWHVDENSPDNDNQCCGSGFPHFKVAVEQADGQCDLEYEADYGDRGDPFPGQGGSQNPNETFDADSVPDSRAYDGHDTKVALRNIAVGGGVVTVDIWLVEDVTGLGSSGEGGGYGGLVLGVPNPFEPGSSIRFYTRPSGAGGESVPARLAVYDARGRRVRTLVERVQRPGLSETTWDGRDGRGRPVASGVYFVAFEAGGERTVEKLLLAR